MSDENGRLRKEAYQLKVQEGRLYILGSDRRGTVYGMKMSRVVIMSVAVAFAISVILGPVIIPFLRKLKVGQTERDRRYLAAIINPLRIVNNGHCQNFGIIRRRKA